MNNSLYLFTWFFLELTWTKGELLPSVTLSLCLLPLIFKISSLKLLCQLWPNINVVVMMFVWSSTFLHHCILICQSTWLPLAIIHSDWLKLEKSSLKLVTNYIYLVTATDTVTEWLMAIAHLWFRWAPKKIRWKGKLVIKVLKMAIHFI
jgi:hypothetical protein